MVVFCCKQKTPYDWRISDWSSYLCSSDLRRERVKHVEPRWRPVVRAEQRAIDFRQQIRIGIGRTTEHHAVGMVEMGKGLGEGRHAAIDHDLEIGPEIGKASSMERVCQHGYNSAAALALKKKRIVQT